MVTSTQIRTAEQLAAMPADGRRYELVEGELRMMSPAGGRHGRIAARLNALLWNHVAAYDLGEVYAAETGFLISRDPDTVRAPDAAFVRRDRADDLEDPTGYPALAPDLVAEVVSPSDTFSDVEAKAQRWLRAGTSMVLVVDPANRTLHVYRTSDNIAVLRTGDVLAADEVVSGWRLAVDDLFG